MTQVKEKESESQNPLARFWNNWIVKPFRESRSEMKKVVWPTREETLRLTGVVVALSAVIGFILFTADAIFQWLLLLLQNAVS